MNNIIYLFFLVSGLIASLLIFYEAFRVQVNRGVIVESKLELLFSFLVFIIQPVLPGQFLFNDDPFYTLIVMLVVALIFIVTRIYIRGRLITIYNTSKRTLVERIQNNLRYFSIPFTEEEGGGSDEHFFYLEDNVVIKISSSGADKEHKNYRLSFKKWWRLYFFQEIKDSLFDVYRKEREEEVFWKEILLNLGLGISVLSFTFFVLG